MIRIFRGTFSEAVNIQNLLENNNIEVFIENEYMSTIQPWAITSGGVNPVALKVKDEDFGKTKEILEDYINGKINLENKK